MKMEISELNRWGKLLEDELKLRSMPIALKFFEHAEDVPEDAVFPMKKYGKHMAMCQAFSYTRMKGLTMALTTEDHWCWTPLVSYGNVECEPGQPSFDEICKVIGIPGKEKAEEFFKTFPRLPLHKYETVVTAPLKVATFEPDVVIIYADPAKTNYMIRAIKSAIGGLVSSMFDGIDSCIYCVLPSMELNEYRITFPDPGDRERAHARDDEVILTVPGPRMKEFMDAMEKNLSHFYGFSDRLFEFNLDFPHPGFYNRLFKMWGLADGEEWDVVPPKSFLK